MSERQVQYTDGSWSREVEVSDDLLDEATRFAEYYREDREGEILLALIERVRAAEEDYHELIPRFGQAVIERDAARGKIDAVRERVAGAERGVARDVLAILDEDADRIEKEGA